jgi:hypothetical protein
MTNGIGVNRRIARALKALVHIAAYRCDRIGLALKRRNWGKTAWGRAFIDIILYPADIYKIAMQYRDAFGHFPSLWRPKTFNEWLQKSKIIGRKPLYTQFADKLLVREFVRERVGEDVLTRILWSGNDILEARELALPKKFVVKANNGSGTNLIVKDSATMDWQHVSLVTRDWMMSDHSVHCAEWQYRWIEPRILIEEFLQGPEGNIPIDYKFFCFNGRAKIVQVDLDRFENHTRLLLDRAFVPLPLSLLYPRATREVRRPGCFDRMLQIAEILSADERFLRVDMYDLGTPKFGELTLHPGSGLEKFNPHEWDQRIFGLLEGRELAEA